MLHKVTCRAVAAMVFGCLLAAQASALTVGRARGAVLLGRPLELSIAVTLDGPGEDAPCASAEIFYGEERVRRAPTVQWQGGAGGEGVLRLALPVPVDEPMVTVFLKVGCGQPVTRRFVLLPEVPPESEPVAAPPARAAAPVPAPVRSAASVAVATPQRQTGPANARAATSAPDAAPGPRRAQPGAAEAAIAALRAERTERAAARAPSAPSAPSARGVPAPLPRARKPERPASQPRLELEPLDLGPERVSALRLTTELRTQVAADPQQRAAAAALWQALQRGPEETLRDGVRLQALERELKSLREQAQDHAGTVAQMRAQVEQARGERRIAATVAGALSLLLLAAAGWLGWRRYHSGRMDRVGRWFEQHGDSVISPEAVLKEPSVTVARTPAPAPAAAVAPVAAAALPAAASRASAAAAVRRAAAPVPPTPVEDFPTSRGGSMRMVGVQELIDVHDKADFFLSIGEDEQAAAVLEAHVHDQVDTSALAWMDLLELYHSLGKRGEYERLRSEFRQRFLAQVPEFDQFDQPGATLENYPRALSRIVALWPSERALDVIEESIFHKPGLPGGQSFSLEAYRELVLLYHVARDLQQEPEPLPAGETDRLRDTSVQPLNAEPAATMPAESELLLIPPASSRLGVDIDLGELPPLDFDLDEPEVNPALQLAPKRA